MDDASYRQKQRGRELARAGKAQHPYRPSLPPRSKALVNLLPNATQNLYPIDTSTLRLQRQYVNGTIKGKAYFAGDPSSNGGANFWVVHLWGATPYELGFAHGRMMQKEALHHAQTA